MNTLSSEKIKNSLFSQTRDCRKISEYVLILTIVHKIPYDIISPNDPILNMFVLM